MGVPQPEPLLVPLVWKFCCKYAADAEQSFTGDDSGLVEMQLLRAEII